MIRQLLPGIKRGNLKPFTTYSGARSILHLRGGVKTTLEMNPFEGAKSTNEGFRPALEHPPEFTFQDEDPSGRPPYARPPLEEFGETKWRASCQCGQVKYSLRREKPLNAKFCHCRGCQVMHGAPFQWAAIFPKDDLRFDNGTKGLSFYAARERNTKYQTPTKVSCATCRTPIMDEGRNMCLLFPQLIDFSGSVDEQRERIATFLPS